jgi:hypothetical protein
MRSLQSLVSGDILVTATRLHEGVRYPTGDGALRQLRPDLSQRGTADTGTIGLVAHLAFDGEGHLWALDPQARAISRFDRDGRPLPRPALGDHPFGPMLLLPGGDLLLGEHLAGPAGPFAGTGRVHRFDAALRPVATLETEWNGGIGGFLGVTHMALGSDGRILYHLSETGPHIYAHEIGANRRLGPVFTREAPPAMLFGLSVIPGGDILVATGTGLIRLRPAAGRLEQVSAIALPPPSTGRPGWANVVLRPSATSVFALDFLGGRLAEVDLASETVLRLADLGLASALASLVEVP